MEYHSKSSLLTVLIILCMVLFLHPDFQHPQEVDKVNEIDELISIYHDYGLFNGTVLVVENGEVIYKKGFGWANMEWSIPNKPDTKFRIGSITKQFTSMLILQLMEEEKIDLQGKLSDYLPYYREDTGSKVTIHHLLTHTSGIPSYTSLSNFFEKVSRDPFPVNEFVEKYCSGDLEFEPGSKFVYNNSGYFLLGAVIEEITGRKYADILRDKIFDPLKMKSTGYDHFEIIIPNRATGYQKTFDGYENAPYLDMSLPYAAGSLYSTVEDLYLWDQSLYSEKLLSKEKKGLLFKPHVKAMGGSYGYGWTIRQRNHPVAEKKLMSISHGGGINGFNTLIERLVDDRHLIVLFNNTPGVSLGAISSEIINILYGKPYTAPKKSIAEALYKTMIDKDVKAAIKQYHDLKKGHPKEYNFLPPELNRLGYYLLRERIKDAIEIFKLNVEVYPKYANGYDSLGEAYLKDGKKELAIKNYAKSLELNPKNTNAIEKLNEIMKKESE